MIAVCWACLNVGWAARPNNAAIIVSGSAVPLLLRPLGYGGASIHTLWLRAVILLCMQLTYVQKQTNSWHLANYTWLLLLVLCIYSVFLIFVSTIPYDHYVRPTKPILQDFLYGWHNKIFLFDIVQNIIAYIPLGFMFYLVVFTKFNSHWLSILSSILISLILSSSLEITQSFNPIRVSSLLDMILNTIGGFIGGLIAWLVILSRRFWLKQIQLNFKLNSNYPKLQISALFLLLIWVAYHFYPYIPSLHPSHIKYALKPIFLVYKNIELFNHAYFLKYFIQGLLLYLVSIPLLKPNRRFLMLGLFVGAVMMVKLTIISRYLTFESLLGLASAILMCEILFQSIRLASYCLRNTTRCSSSNTSSISSS